MSASRSHNITIKAIDGTSQTFRVIGQSGAAMATQVEASGKRAAAGLTQVDAAAKTTNASLRGMIATAGGFNAAAASAGAGLATFAGIMADAARAAAEEQAGLDRLVAAVDATGASFDRYAGNIDQAVRAAMALSFADDQAVDALSVLTTTTGDAQRSLELLGLSMDLARGKGIDLATAAGIIGKVAAGNTAILTRYGIVIDENASSTEALAAIQQRFSGQADAFAQSQAGAAARIKNALDDMVESVGASTGDLQTLLLIMPGLSTAFTLGAGAIGAFAASETAAAVAARGLIASLGPLGLLLAGGTAVVGVLAHQIGEAQSAADAARDPVDTLTTSILNLGNAADQSVAKMAAADIIEGWKQAAEAAKQAEQEIETVRQQLTDKAMGRGGIMDPVTAGILDQEIKDLETQADKLDDLALTNQELKQIEADLLSLRLDQRDNQADLLVQADQLIDKYNLQEISGRELYDGIGDLVRGHGDLARSMGVTAQASQGVTGTLLDQHQAFYDVGRAIDATVGKYEAQAAAARNAADASREAMQQVALNSGQGFGLLNTDQQARFRAELDAMERESEDAARRETDRQRQREQALRDQISAVEAYGRAQEQAQDATEDRNDALQRQGQLTADHERELAQITRDRVQAQKRAEQDLAQTVKGLQQQREQSERELMQTLNQLEAQRRELITDTEDQLADLAVRRGQIQADAAAKAAAAEAQWQESSAENLRQQADLRDQLRQSTAEAAKRWQDLNRENLAQQREIRQELRRTLEEQNLAFARDQEDIRRQIAYTEEALRVTSGERGGTYDAQGVADAQRQLEELRTEQRRSEEDHERERSEARRNARDEEQRLEGERRSAEAAYQAQVRQNQQETAQRIQELERERAAAAEAFHRQEQEANADAARQLEELASEEQRILEERAQKFAEIEQQKRVAARDSAREQQTLARQTAAAEEKAQRETAKIRQESIRAAAEAERQYREQATAAAEDVAEAQARVVETVEEVTDAYAVIRRGAEGTVNVRTGQARSEISLLRQELEQLAEDYSVRVLIKRSDRDDEPLDGPPPRRNSGNSSNGRITNGLNGVVVTPSIKAAMGRVVTVGEVRQESLILPFGSMVVPDGGVRARNEGGATVQYIFPNARFELRSADIAYEVARQVQAARR